MPDLCHQDCAAISRLGKWISLAGLALFLCLGWLWWRHTSAEKEHLVLYFSQSVNGLNLGSPVKIQGVDVGQVEGIQITGPLGSREEYYAKVKVVLRAKVLREKGLATNLEQEAALRREIAQGLRGRLSLLSPMIGSYYVALVYNPRTPVRLVGVAGEAEVPVLESELLAAGESVAEKIVRLGEIDLAARAREWEVRLDQWQAATHPGHFAAANVEVLERIARAKEILGPDGIALEIRRLNGGLERFRAAMAEQDESLADRIKDGHSALAVVQQSLGRANRQVLDLVTVLEFPGLGRLQVPPEVEAFRELLEQVNGGRIFPPERMLPYRKRAVHTEFPR